MTFVDLVQQLRTTSVRIEGQLEGLAAGKVRVQEVLVSNDPVRGARGQVIR
jgi:hypothetical protein